MRTSLVTWKRPPLPPGLREFAEADGISEKRMAHLAQMWGTIRGHKPQTADEWRTLYRPIEEYLRRSGLDQEQAP